MVVQPAGGRWPLDATVVPVALLLIARELALYQPTREIAWMVLHDARVARRAPWIVPFLPAPPARLDADPLALLLAALAVLLAGVYMWAARKRARPRVRAGLLAVAAVLLVALPTLACIGLGLVLRVPFGQDGGVVQLPLALELIVAGESPYGADYSQSILGRQSRNSEFWAPFGGNPITRHHWYLPGVHALMLPPYAALRAAFGFFDPRLVMLPFLAVAAWLAARFARGQLEPDGDARALTAAAVVLLNPFVWWPLAFGATDMLCVVPLLLAVLAAERGRPLLSAALVGVACATRQLAWPFAPFLWLHLSAVDSWSALLTRVGLLRLVRPVLVSTIVAIVIVAPVALRDTNAFADDIFRYQIGVSGADLYPLGGTPGFGIANFLIYSGAVKSLAETFPFGRFYVLFVPLGLWLVTRQLRAPGVAMALVNGSAALLASLYLSRNVNANFFILAALLLPLAVLRDKHLAWDIAVVPLALMAVSVEASGGELLRTTWAAATSLGHVAGLPSWLEPGDGPRWRDPLSLAWSALAAGIALVYLAVVPVRREPTRPRAWRRRTALIGIAALTCVALPAWLVVRAASATGQPRAEDRFAAELRGAPRLERISGRVEVTPLVRESWARSWRKKGEKVYTAEDALGSRQTLGRLLGRVDVQAVSLLALTAIALLVSRRREREAGAMVPAGVRPDARAGLVGLVLLASPLVVGAVFGAGIAIALGLILAAVLGARAGSSAWARLGVGAASGAAAALFPETALALPFIVLVPNRTGTSDRGLGLVAFAAAWLALWIPSAVAAPSVGRVVASAGADSIAFVTAIDVSVGLIGLLAYRGVEGLPWSASLFVLACWLVGAALWFIRRRQRAPTDWPLAALASLAALWLAPWNEPHGLFLPAALLVGAHLDDRSANDPVATAARGTE